MEEKMLILKMLQEGKITTDDAVKLLEALEKSTPNTASPGSRINELKEELAAKLNEMKLDEKLNKFGEKATKFAETLGEKAGKLASQISENINSEKTNSGEKFTEEFVKRMESLGQDIAESASKLADAFASQLANLFETGYEKYKYNSSYTYPVSEGACLYLKTNNFQIKAEPSEVKEITLNLYVNSNLPQLVVDDYFKTIVDGNTYRLSTDFPGRTWGKMEIQVPKGMDVISLSTDNAKCDIGAVDSRHLSCTTSNGRVMLTKCSVDELEVFTDNEKILLDEVAARSANLRTSNAKVVLDNCSVDNVDAKTSNAPVVLSAQPKGASINSNYILYTTNGKIDAALGTSENCGHMVDAHTTMGSIDVSLANLSYTMDKKSIGMQSNAQVWSENFDSASSKVTVKAYTSNAPINISGVK